MNRVLKQDCNIMYVCFVLFEDDGYFGFCFQVESEYRDPKSQDRIPSGKLPQMWGQSLYVLGKLVKEVSVLL